MGLLDRFKKSDKDSVKVAASTVAKTTGKTGSTVAVKPVATITKAGVTASNVTAVLVRPLVTEKSTKTGAYYFQVLKSASKNEIAKAFKARFGKTARKVNIINVMGKTKFRGRTAGKRADWKKAAIYLNKGETVDTSK